MSTGSAKAVGGQKPASKPGFAGVGGVAVRGFLLREAETTGKLGVIRNLLLKQPTNNRGAATKRTATTGGRVEALYSVRTSNNLEPNALAQWAHAAVIRPFGIRIALVKAL